MKYKQVDKIWKVQGELVKTFNAEEENEFFKPDVSWSHGATHFYNIKTKEVKFCGQSWFEDNATLYEHDIICPSEA